MEKKNRERRTTHKRYHNQRSRVERGRRKSEERVESFFRRKTKRQRGRETFPEETLTYGDWNNKGKEEAKQSVSHGRERLLSCETDKLKR